MNKKSAFTLIELSVVLIIIMILAAGLMKASGMIKTSRIANARSITANSIVPKIDGLAAWYETSSAKSFNVEETHDGAQLTKWFDISPLSIIEGKNILTRSASTAVTYEESGINNIASLQHSGSSSYLQISNLASGNINPSTIFIVFKPSTISTSWQNLIDSSTSSSNSYAVSFRSTQANLNSGSGGISYTKSFAANTNYILSAYINKTYSKVYINDAGSKLTGSGDTGSNSLEGLTIGCLRSGSGCFYGLLSEVIIYNRPLKKQERKDVMKYLSIKYQIPVNNL